MDKLTTYTGKILSQHEKTAIILADGSVVEKGHEYLAMELAARGVDKKYIGKIVFELLGLQHQNPTAIENILNEHASNPINKNHVADTKAQKEKFARVMAEMKRVFAKQSALGPDELIKSRFGLTGDRFSFLALPGLAALFSVNRQNGDGIGIKYLEKYGYDSKQLASVFNVTGEIFKQTGFDRFSKETFNTSMDFETAFKDFDKIVGVNETTQILRNTNEVETHSGTRELFELAVGDMSKPENKAKLVRAQLAHEITPHQKHHFNLNRDKRSATQMLVMTANHIAKGDITPDLKTLYGADKTIDRMFYNTRTQINEMSR
jgi:hypothetical protein